MSPNMKFCSLQGCQKWCRHPYNEAQRIEHATQCSDRANREQSRQISSEQECAICLDLVMEKENPSDRRFGLMSCDHTFCLGCVRGWRSNADGEADVNTVSPAKPALLAS